MMSAYARLVKAGVCGNLGVFSMAGVARDRFQRFALNDVVDW